MSKSWKENQMSESDLRCSGFWDFPLTLDCIRFWSADLQFRSLGSSPLHPHLYRPRPMTFLKKYTTRLPVVKNTPCETGGIVQSLVRDDPICCRTTKPLRQNYPALHVTNRAHVPTTRAYNSALQREESPQWEGPCPTAKSSSRWPQLEKGCAKQRRPRAVNKWNK